MPVSDEGVQYLFRATSWNCGDEGSFWLTATPAQGSDADCIEKFGLEEAGQSAPITLIDMQSMARPAASGGGAILERMLAGDPLLYAIMLAQMRHYLVSTAWSIGTTVAVLGVPLLLRRMALARGYMTPLVIKI